MVRTPPRSSLATRATELVVALQQRFVAGLERASAVVGPADRFSAAEWLRDDGRHGGGVRWGMGDSAMYQRASINVSTVHYDDLPDRKLACACALSSIVHPADPRRPSLHLHVSWTQLRDASGYWRVMADLNPCLPVEDDRLAFLEALRRAAPDLYEGAIAQGDRYFYIPALGRHRGVAHFYLEGHDSGSWERDAEMAGQVEASVIDFYCGLLGRALPPEPPTEAQLRAQLDYHTLYLFQVLTLDRGTTSGLMIHDQNDEGIMGSLPAFVDRALLASWRERVPVPQGELVEAIASALPAGERAEVTAELKRKLAQVVREHYRRHPAALELQASGTVIPPTVDNHR